MSKRGAITEWDEEEGDWVPVEPDFDDVFEAVVGHSPTKPLRDMPPSFRYAKFDESQHPRDEGIPPKSLISSNTSPVAASQRIY